MNPYYEKIIALKEAKAFQPIVERWKVLSQNISHRPAPAPVLLPDMLWVARSGVGRTHLLKLMTAYLDSLGNLMEFYGDVKFFEFVLGYCNPDSDFLELHRLMEEATNAAGFRSEFRGVVHIDISQWQERFEERHFVNFMEYLAARSEDWLIVLSVSLEDEKALKRLTAFLSMYLRIEAVKLELPKTEDLLDNIQATLSGYGLSLDAGARQLLFEAVEHIRKSKYFDGYKSIRMLCQDIVYSVFSRPNFQSRCLSAEDLAQFSVNSEYVKRTVSNIERANRIGLVGQGG